MEKHEPRRVALIGGAPSFLKAPYKHDNWEIWATSPSIYDKIPRCDVWFQLHTPNDRPDLKKHWEDLKTHSGEVMVFSEAVQAPNRTMFPRQHIIDTYGDDFLTSGIAWMMAKAIDELQEGDFLGLWGVDMATDEEYKDQRPGCKHFMKIAAMKGINVVVPPECDLLVVPPPYPNDDTPAKRKAIHRLEIVKQAAIEADKEIDKHKLMKAHAEGERKALEIFINNIQ